MNTQYRIAPQSNMILAHGHKTTLLAVPLPDGTYLAGKWVDRKHIRNAAVELGVIIQHITERGYTTYGGKDDQNRLRPNA
jgi:hypothetical protein